MVGKNSLLGSDSGAQPRCRADIFSELWWRCYEVQGCCFFLTLEGWQGKIHKRHDSSVTMCRAAIYSELWWGGGEELAGLLFILNSGGC
jgi:hypothetical protein